MIGKNYGDEGKGLATDFFVSSKVLPSSEAIVIKHNGGAQAGHTVELKDGRRFVFHQLSSGSLRKASTLWVDTYMPDLYKLGEEAEAFRDMCSLPRIFSSVNACPVILYDVILNQALEDGREESRHGSCGMGINEASLRIKAGYGLSVEDFLGLSASKLKARLITIKEEYVSRRLEQLSGEVKIAWEYTDLLNNETVLNNYIDDCLYNTNYITPLDDSEIGRRLDNASGIVLEGAQGLLLDIDRADGAPHLTASKTGLHNPLIFTSHYGIELTEVCYVTRSYVTRHGNGPLPLGLSSQETEGFIDRTNVPNKWQGTLRYACHESPQSFVTEVINDSSSIDQERRTLLITHLNETDGKILMGNNKTDIGSISQIRDTFSRVYRSFTPYSDDII